jgi:ketosteroid isomerase-like protein/GNAT superfamily N-acetyltransferase
VSGIYLVRPAEPGDLAVLPEIERQASARFAGLDVEPSVLADVTGLADFQRAEERGLLWVAVAGDGTVVGFALVEMVDGNAHLDEIDVLPAHGRRGIGAALVRAVSAFARRAGVGAVTLTTFRDIGWNAPFYAKLGFRTLDPAQWTPGLARVVAQETAAGLDPKRRVVMRYATDAPPAPVATSGGGEPLATAERNKQVVRDWVAKLTAGDADGVCNLYAPDLRYYVVGDWPLGGHFGRAYMEQNCRDVFVVFPRGLHFTAERLVAEGDWVCLEMRSRGEHSSGRTYRNHYTYWFEIRDGLIVQLKEWLDTLHANDVLCGAGRPIDFQSRRE